ncbi:hypothetical protein DL766_000429 [Monosporascus sp. MC13-8B]|nr:hypothetical protein DL763_001803 [Monosporascus cannonballus]RYP39404.1 hypothetical protein DL766_000429 [Monosporascus sp. MC13-8B]
MGVTVGNDSASRRVPESFTRGPRMAPRFATVTAAFYHHAKTQPGEIAARDLSTSPAREITYASLAHRAIKLSRQLRSVGVTPGDKVPLVVKRGIEMLVGAVAILTCGAQYVPMDGGVVPDSALKTVLKQTAAKVVLCLNSTKHRLDGVQAPCEVLVVEETDGHAIEPQSLPVYDDLAESHHGCYIIFTSGTTGTPKGVDVTHKNVANLICSAPGNLGIKRGTKVGQVLNISFDMAAWETLGTLCNGGTLVIRGSDWRLALSQINTLICTPSILAKYDPQEFPNIRTVATAGEPISQRLADLWASHVSYYNCCGPTETTIVNTMHLHQSGQPLSIGKPTPNNTVYILDEEGRPVGIGEPGIQWAGGHGISRGYIGLPDKTAEKYKLDPFANDGSMMYNTGDLAAWRENGEIEMLGRVDDQIKIKGFRVELDGVTASLNAYPAVDKAAAIFIDGEIHAFMAPEGVDVNALKQHLGTSQPYYAVPTKYHLLEAMPLTPNGKTDKKALKRLAGEKASQANSLSTSSSSSLVAKHLEGVTEIQSTPTASTPSSSSISEKERDDESFDLSQDVPSKILPQPLRGLVHRVFIVYRRLFSLLGLFNIAAVFAVAYTADNLRQWLAWLTAINLLIAVLIREEFVINILYTICCSIPKSFPLSIRARAAKIYHLGGAHSGAAICSGLLLLGTNISDEVCQVTHCPNWGHQGPATKVISWMLSAGFAIMWALAYPTMRKSHHDLFERTHRFIGWTMLALFWVQTILATHDTLPAGLALGQAVLRNPAVWMLVVATLSVASSWFFLRKVPVEAEVLSNHAVRLHFGYTVPVNGSFTRISHRPLIEWHSFATIPAYEKVGIYPKGYSLVVSSAGDWTKNCIEKPPREIYVRGVPTCGVMRIATLFRRLVVVCTGSGVGPVLGHLQNPSCPTQVIWSTPKPQVTFGQGVIDAVRSKIPNAIIHDTREQGRPDLVKMSYNLVKSFDAEAVIIIANEKITKKVVYGLETRGVYAFGAIWDS